MRMTGALLVRFTANVCEVSASAKPCTGAFVAAPVGGLLWGFGACGLRLATLYVVSRIKGHRFDALDRPIPQTQYGEAFEDREAERVLEPTDEAKKSGKFF